MNELLNKQILKVWTDDDKEILIFDTPNERLFYLVTGDCCSTSSVESILNIENLIGEIILKVIPKKFSKKYVKQEQKKDPDRYEVLKIWGYTLKTVKGYTDIEMRNNSNGYYNGECDYKGIVTNIMKVADLKDDYIKFNRIDPDTTHLIYYKDIWRNSEIVVTGKIEIIGFNEWK